MKLSFPSVQQFKVHMVQSNEGTLQTTYDRKPYGPMDSKHDTSKKYHPYIVPLYKTILYVLSILIILLVVITFISSISFPTMIKDLLSVQSCFLYLQIIFLIIIS